MKTKTDSRAVHFTDMPYSEFTDEFPGGTSSVGYSGGSSKSATSVLKAPARCLKTRPGKIAAICTFLLIVTAVAVLLWYFLVKENQIPAFSGEFTAKFISAILFV